MLGNTAEELGVSRMTLYRLIQDDKELKKYVADHDFRYQRMPRRG
jgi:predicted DNA-binding transcriptional regulator AlpA